MLARLVPPGLVRQVLAEAKVVSRTRRTSAVSGFYLVLGLVLFPGASICRVFEKLAGVWGRPGSAVPAKSSLVARRAGLGPEPFRLLFEHLRSAGPQVAGGVWAGLRVCAVDGTLVQVPDSTGNAGFGRHRNQKAAGAFPLVRLLVVVACGSRALIDAAFDGIGVGEPTLAGRVAGCLDRGMLLLADRGFGGFALWCRAAESGAELLWRITRRERLSPWRLLPDGSHLAWRTPAAKTRKASGAELPERVLVRVVTGHISVIDERGARSTEAYRLITTLIDHERYPAAELLRLYARRWQVEVMIKGLKCTQLAGCRLRSKTCDGVRQELWAALCVHQLLRIEAAHAEAEPDQAAGTEIRQINFTVLVDRLRDAIVRTAGRGGADAELALLRRALAADTTPIDIRGRIWDRVVKQPIRKFPAKKPRHTGRTVSYEYTIYPQPADRTRPPTPQPADPQPKAKITA